MTPTPLPEAAAAAAETTVPPAETARPAAGAEPLASRDVPVADLHWRTSYRLIPTRFPTVGLYDRVADSADLDVVFAIEALTNTRIRDAMGQLHLVPPEERVTGAGSTMVMAAFTHLNPEGSRFSDGRYGVYYAAATLDTAVAEVSHHRAKFLARTREPAIDIDLRAIVAGVQGRFHDLRGLGARAAAVLDPGDYRASQSFARALRDAGSAGVQFPSVRHVGGTCIGAFRPKTIVHAKAGVHIALHWDGGRITHWYEKRAPHAVDEPGV